MQAPHTASLQMIHLLCFWFQVAAFATENAFSSGMRCTSLLVLRHYMLLCSTCRTSKKTCKSHLRLRREWAACARAGPGVGAASTGAGTCWKDGHTELLTGRPPRPRALLRAP